MEAEVTIEDAVIMTEEAITVKVEEIKVKLKLAHQQNTKRSYWMDDRQDQQESVAHVEQQLADIVVPWDKGSVAASSTSSTGTMNFFTSTRGHYRGSIP